MNSSYQSRPPQFEQTSRSSWDNWVWQHQNRLKTPDDFSWIDLTESEASALEAGGEFRVAVTPHYAALIDPTEPGCPVRRQAIPTMAEFDVSASDLRDPLAEDSHSPVPGITHRYPDRVLFYVSHHCPVYCRHCTRKRKVSDPTTAASDSQIDRGLNYIREHNTVRDVLVSGGDPLSLSDEKLAKILKALREIDHVEVIRLGTRNPVTLPQRVTRELALVLETVAPIYLHTHFNHVDEWTAESRDAIAMLRSAGAVLGNQMVLLRGVNDTSDEVMALNRQLLAAGCRPYYMLQCDMAEGISHFRTPISTGIELIDALRGRIGGMGIPDFVVDLPGGGGKIELTPEYIVERTEGEILFRNYEGKTFRYDDR